VSLTSETNTLAIFRYRDDTTRKAMRPNGSRMMPLPSLQICRQPRMALIFDLARKVDRFMPLPCGPCAIWYQNQFIRSQNIVFTTLVTDKQPVCLLPKLSACLCVSVCNRDTQTCGQVENIMPLPASRAWRRH